ncbi:hypothetical protein C2S53_011945 [Perilla frutescens var. hirtella]|uniref:Alpha-farnesene synthase n=1 Tax=Perilla frutescens var. hirtella TaxID=608512 RepID=A0AAD4JDV0_PERFH|nr:hypothetical protein C2S53_011945 [Perilla frutescens var. hirtella]
MVVSATPQRRTANYKPNIWNYDYLESLTSKYHEEKYEREVGTLKEQVRGMFCASKDPLHKLELIDLINKLALSHYFEKEISESIEGIKSTSSSMTIQNDLYSSALYFRILRQHGHHVPQDTIVELLDNEEEEEEEEELTMGAGADKARNEIFEASHLALDGECCLVDRAKAILENVAGSGKCPWHLTVSWFNAKKHMRPAENKSALHKLAGLSFNMIQVQHQKDLKEILRWWRNLGLLEVLTFSRDRVVESFLWAVGVAYEPQYGSLRKWLTKVILLVLIIDDVYDIYGSKHELEQFTIAVERWDPSEIQHLPEVIKRCFWTLYNTASDIDDQVQKQKGWSSVLPQLKQVWTGFCKALLVEAKWNDDKGHPPSLLEYLDNGWTSSSGPVLSLHILLAIGEDMQETMAAFHSNQQLIHHASLIIRLCNDQGTSQAELERGDAPSSIVCHMREANVTEKEARSHIRNLISNSWKKINGVIIRCGHEHQLKTIRYIVNTARVATFIYQNGDGFGVQDRETRDQVLSCLIQPVQLSPSSPFN